MADFLWILDNGHGGIIDGKYQTAGKRSPVWPDGRQLFEGEFNRAIVKRIAKLCDAASMKYHIIADTEEDKPLTQRTHEANDIYLNGKGKGLNCVYLSIHANAFKQEKADGWVVYTSKGNTISDKFATVFWNECKKKFPNERFRTDAWDGDPDYESQFWVLRKTYMPAVLTENFFMTNKKDCDIILSEEGRDKIAQGHFDAMVAIENGKF